MESRSRFLPSVEGARGLAAVSVLTYHASLKSSPGVIHSWTSRGWLGVPLFFLLSGLLLFRPFAHAVIRRRPLPSLARYWKARVLRIVPAYWVALSVSILVEIRTEQASVLEAAAVVAWVWCWWTGRRPWPALALTAVCVPLIVGDDSWLVTGNFFDTFIWNDASNFLLVWIPFGRYTLMGVSWTLCIEMSFYVLMPLAVIALSLGSRRVAGPRRRAAMLVVPLLATPALSFWFVPAVGTTHYRQLAIPAYADEFAIGMLLAIALELRPSATRLASGSVLATAAVAALLANLFLFHVGTVDPYGNGGSMLFSRTMEVAFALALWSVLVREEPTPLGRLLGSRPLRAAGLISYGLYLWHPFVIDQLRVRGLWQQDPVANVLLVAALTIGAAVASWYVIERPALRLKDVPRPRRLPAPVPVPAD